jgi:ParB family chromosome partitioning protein
MYRSTASTSAGSNTLAYLREIDTRSVVIGDRARKELGDLAGLCQSIARVGLLHPIVINRDGELIAGRRRIAAYNRLGRTLIHALVVEDLADAVERLIAERDENTERLDMLPSEKAALGQRLEELERPSAKDAIREAQARGRETRWGSKDATVSSHAEHERGSAGPSPTIRVKAKVGEALGMSGSTYNQLKRVAKAAEEGDESAQQAMKEIDASGKIRGVADRWAGEKSLRDHPEREKAREKIKQKGRSGSSATVSRRHMGPKSIRSALRQLQLIEQASYALAGVADGLSGVLPLSDDIDKESIGPWQESMRRSLTKIREFLREMEASK